MSKKVLMLIAEKSETVEIVAPVDTLRRIEGIEVTIASIYSREPVKTTAGIIITPDVALSEVDRDAFDAIVMPGGEGYVNLAGSALVGEILKNQYDKGKLVAGICLSPNVFLAHDIGLGSKLTSYPYATEGLRAKYDYLEEPVVQDRVS
jgi:putative intracellular protease/amidase